MRAQVDPRRKQNESGFNLERIFIQQIINIIHCLVNCIVPWSASYVSYRNGHQTHLNHSEICLQVASAETLPGHSDIIERNVPPSHM